MLPSMRIIRSGYARVIRCKPSSAAPRSCPLDPARCDDYGRIIPVARAMREQVDWSTVRRDVASNDFAAVFLVLLERIGVIDPAEPAAGADRPGG